MSLRSTQLRETSAIEKPSHASRPSGARNPSAILAKSSAPRNGSKVYTRPPSRNRNIKHTNLISFFDKAVEIENLTYML
jgi:hypothetical protein